MENVNLHKSKIFAIVIALVGIISHFLPWWHVSYNNQFFNAGGLSYSINGLHKLGIISFICFIAAGIVPVVMGDKTKPFEGQEKMITAICFGAAAFFAVLTLVFNLKFLSFGIFIAIIAGIAGAAVAWGLVKTPE